ncbi:hypothetical protein MYX04_12480 [Nitrospiraceae bacterium AH_259_D15_M11_P09]|nr:hypothetical protein [Nitrospiraceae bacterium AH_259_D15_M11_P09]
MTTVLRSLNIDEISLVDAPANPGARITIFKRDDQPVKDSVRKRAWSLIVQEAERLRADGHAPTLAQAIAKALQQPEMKVAYESYRAGVDQGDIPEWIDIEDMEAPGNSDTCPSDEVLKEIEDHALDRVTKGLVPTFEQAVAQLVAETPDLYDRYRSAMQQRGG